MVGDYENGLFRDYEGEIGLVNTYPSLFLTNCTDCSYRGQFLFQQRIFSVVFLVQVLKKILPFFFICCWCCWGSYSNSFNSPEGCDKC